jgi:beta-galactosidase
MELKRTSIYRIGGDAARRKSVQILLWLNLAAVLVSSANAQRITIPLDGMWTIGDSIDANVSPSDFDHTVQVPGLVHSAKPAFPDVDQYQTQEFIGTMIRDHVFPASEAIDTLGRTPQTRMFFWYKRSFRLPAKKERALLIVNKAQFGTAVWLNGKKVGEHMGCFTPGHFDLTPAVHWNAENEVLIRIGAHPGSLPTTVIYGGDGEKEFWTPGIYDDVSVIVSDAPAIDSVQVAPRLESSDIVVETELINAGPARQVTLRQQVKTWKGGRAVGRPGVQQIYMAAGERKTVRQTIHLPDATLWSPDDPFLYILDTSSGGDSSTVRFGMRELHFDAERAILNGKPIYLRGASITLHRFFGDPNSAELPWDDAWVRKLLVDIPKRMHWNGFRICIGPVPQHWLDVADEAGLLLQYEFPIWDDRKPLHQKLWDKDEILTEFKEYVRDNWNHPSLVLWDASNETHWSYLGDTVIPTVRTMDLSNRPWENGYNGPQGSTDPYEIHPYKFLDYHFKQHPEHNFEMSDLENPNETKLAWQQDWPGHATIINEYDWLWLHRDGHPTILTQQVFDHIPGPDATADQRFLSAAYLLAGLTEYHRAFRKHAAVFYLAYLDGEGPHIFTCDNFRNVRTLEFQPYFEDYMKEAFKPLGVYINFWQPKLDAGAKRTFRVMMVNDTEQAMTGKLTLTLERSGGGQAEAHAETGFDVPALGQAQYDIELTVPQVHGDFVLNASANPGHAVSPTISRRNVTLTEASR